MKIIIILSFILVLSSETKCQELLNTQESYIIKYVTGQNGKLILKRYTHDIATNTHGDVLIFGFPTPEVEKSGLFQATFFFSPEGNCIHYLYRYSNYKSLLFIVNNLDNPNSGLIRKKNTALWTSQNDARTTITVKKDAAFAQPPNFEVNYMQRPVNYVPYKTELDDDIQKMFPGIKKQE